MTITGVVDLARFPQRPRIRVTFFEPLTGQRHEGESSIGLSRRVLAEIRDRAPAVAQAHRERPLAARADGARRRPRDPRGPGPGGSANRGTSPGLLASAVLRFGPALVALGDSLTQGTGSSGPSTSWVGLFRAELEERWGTPARVDNRAVYGAKLADLVANQLPVPAEAALVVMCIGSNDAGRTPVEVFRTEFAKVCAQLPAGSIVADVPEFQWGPRVPVAAVFSQVVRECWPITPS